MRMKRGGCSGEVPAARVLQDSPQPGLYMWPTSTTYWLLQTRGAKALQQHDVQSRTSRENNSPALETGAGVLPVPSKASANGFI